MTLEEKLLFYREIDPKTGCWNWTRSLRSGYGQIYIETGVITTVHRVAYSLWVGEIAGRHICHHCDNRRCFNPEHLFAGTHADNMADAAQKRRLNWGENNHFARLNWKQVRAIRRLTNRGIQQRAVARQFKVTEATVSLIARDLIWKEA